MGGPGRKPGAETSRSGGLDRRGWRPSRSGQRVPCAIRAGRARKALARNDHLITLPRGRDQGPEPVPRAGRSAEARAGTDLYRLGRGQSSGLGASVAASIGERSYQVLARA